MYFVPLSQLESVELLIHALRAAAGEADCQQCPARKVCMKQCLTIADSVQAMINNGTLPTLDSDPEPQEQAPFHNEAVPTAVPETERSSPKPEVQPAKQVTKKTATKKSHLHVVK